MGDVLPASDVVALTAVGGLLLVGVALRLLRVRDIAVADLLPSLLVAPLQVGSCWSRRSPTCAEGPLRR